MRREFGPSLKRRKFLPALTVLSNWLIIGASIAIASFCHQPLVSFLAIVIIGARQHALFVMIHEAAHLHISQNKKLNDWISDLFCALPLAFDTEVYRKNHLKHHRNLNTDQDPDWVRKVGQKDWIFPASAGKLAFFTPRFILFTGPLEWGYILWRFSGFGEKTRWQTEPGFLVFKLTYFFTAISVCLYLGIEKEALLYWLTPMFFVLPGIGRIRSIAEHFAVSYSDGLNSTRDVKAGWLEGFLLAPHNVHFHLTHHIYPHIPFYHLPQAHKTLCDSGEFQTAHINSAYVVPYADSVLHDMIHGPKTRSAPIQKLDEAG